MKRRISLGLCLGMGLFFLISGVLKLVEVEEFSRSILRYQLMEGPLVGAFALFVPWLEVAGSAGLVVKRWRLASTWLFIGLLFVFEGALLSALFRGLDIECGCLGSGVASSLQFALIRNILLLGALFWVVYSERVDA